jgi:excisionase family DNA binding protein
VTFKPSKPTPQLMLPWHPGVTISAARAAELLGCSKDNVYDMITDGTLEGFKLRRHSKNSHFRIVAESVYRVLDERKAVGPDRITVEEAAVILGCSPESVRALIRIGDLKAHKMRDLKFSQYRISRADVVRLTHKWRHDAGVADAQDDAPRRSASNF